MTEQDGEEVIISSSGRAIVAGQEISIEDEEHASLCPSWITESSSILKCGLSTAGLLFIAFVSMVIVGLVRQSSSRGDEGFMNAQNEQAIDTNTKSPTSRPTEAIISAIPIESEEIRISFSDSVEQKLLMIADGLSRDAASDWSSIQEIIESTIAVTLLEGLPADYTLGAIELESIDGNAPGAYSMTLADTYHTIIYSSSVVLDCALSDCSVAPGIVEGVVEDSQKGVVQADEQFELTTTNPTSVDAIDEVDTVDQVDVADVETTAPPVQENVDQVDAVDTTDAPVETSAPTSNPTKAPISPAPTESPTYFPTEGIQSLSDASCSQSNPCSACLGACSSDDECASGLLCFKRLYWDNIPGCEGPGRQGMSYCYNPFAEGLTEDVLLTTKNMKCGDNGNRCTKCQGEQSV
jgi:hypothetical protein